MRSLILLVGALLAVHCYAKFLTATITEPALSPSHSVSTSHGDPLDSLPPFRPSTEAHVAVDFADDLQGLDHEYKPIHNEVYKVGVGLREVECNGDNLDSSIECIETAATNSPFAICEPDFIALFAREFKMDYTICCNESFYSASTIYDKGGFFCCHQREQRQCQKAHDVVGCNQLDTNGKKHNITQVEISGVQVCQGTAERSARRVLIGLGWMLAFWVLCVSGFWGL